MIAFPLFVFNWLNAAGCVTAAATATATADPSPASSLSAFQWLRFARDKSQRVSVAREVTGGKSTFSCSELSWGVVMIHELEKEETHTHCSVEVAAACFCFRGDLRFRKTSRQKRKLGLCLKFNHSEIWRNGEIYCVLK